MKRRIRWTYAAADDLEQIKNYLDQYWPERSHSTILKLYNSALELKSFPLLGRTGRENGTREMILENLPYIILYRVTEEAVEVLRIYHGARNPI